VNKDTLPDPASARNTTRRGLTRGAIPMHAPAAVDNDVAAASVTLSLHHHYGVIYADPPWSFATYSHKGKGRSAVAYYDCMGLGEIKALPVADLAAKDCVLFLWTTDPLLPCALEVITAWFTYKTVAFTWVKTTKDGIGLPIGCGYWTRANP